MRRVWSKALWLLAYAVLSAAEYMVSWGKEYVGTKLKAPKEAGQ